MINSTSTAERNNEKNERKSNRVSTIRKKHANLQKARMIETRERTAGDMTVAEWVHKNNVDREFKKHLGKSKTGWRNGNNKKLIVEKQQMIATKM